MFNSSILLLLLTRFLFLLINKNDFINCQQSSTSSTTIEIETELGTISGISIRTFKNNRAIAFMGIPYALPPIGNLRFKKPIPYPKWYPNKLIANSYKKCCPQLDINGLPHGQEDCLYLNIFIPTANLPTQQRFPVMIYIQGESFENGDASLYGPEYLLDYNVIIVTFNYRVGILGFLTTGDKYAIGNWGLYDQLLVLKWIQNNIDSFGGDQTKITLFGQGAGASSAIIHMISPLSTGLFNRIIAQSGSPLCQWSLLFNNYNNTNIIVKELGKKFNCPIKRGNLELIDCLRFIKLNYLLKEQQQNKIFGEYPHRFIPVIEQYGLSHERLIPNDPRKLLIQGNFRRIPLMMGFNKDETSFLYPLILNKQIINQNNKNGNLRHYLEEILLPKFINAILLSSSSSIDRSIDNNNIYHSKLIENYEKEIKQNILYKYFNFLNSKNYPEMAYRFINMSTDALYGSCIDETLKLYSLGTKFSSIPSTTNEHYLSLPFTNLTYKYLFNYRGRNSMLNLILKNQLINYDNGNNNNKLFWWSTNNNNNNDQLLMNYVCHGDELFYLFKLKFSTLKLFDNRDLLIQKQILQLWTDFAKHGFAPFIPNIEQPYWPPYTLENRNTYLIQEKLTTIDTKIYYESVTNFWQNYIPSLKSKITSSSSIVANHSKWHPFNNKNYPLKINNNGRSYQSDNNSLRSITTLRTFAWSMLALSLILFIFIIILMLLLYHQRRRQSFSANTLPSNVYNINAQPQQQQTSAKTIAHLLSSRRVSSSSSSDYYGLNKIFLEKI